MLAFFLSNDIVRMIVLTAKHGMTHGDMSVANMAYVFTNDAWSNVVLQPQLIDFGWSTDEVADPAYDTLQMLRTLLTQYSPQTAPRNRQFLLNHLMMFYNLNFSPRLRSEQDIEPFWETASRRYRAVVETSRKTVKKTPRKAEEVKKTPTSRRRVRSYEKYNK